MLCDRITLLCGEMKKVKGFSRISRYAVPVQKCHPQIVLGGRETLCCRLPVQHCRSGVVNRLTFALLIHKTEVVLCLWQVLLGCVFKPMHCFRVVLRYSYPTLVHVCN